MTWGGASRRTIRIGVSVLVVAGAASAQQAGQVISDLYLDLSTGATASDNYESVVDPSGTSTFLSSNVVLGYRGVTATEAVTFQMGGTYQAGEFADDMGNRGGFTDPFAQFGYERVAANAKLAFSANYRESDVNDISEIDDITGDDLVLDGGTRQSTSASFSVETGLRARFGVSLGLGYADTAYTETRAGTLVDTTRRDAELGLRFDLTRTAALNLTSRYAEIDEQDASAREERQYRTGLGLDVILAPDVRLTTAASLSRNEVEETVAGLRTTRIDEAPTFDIGLTRLLRTGTVSASLSSALTSAGTQTTLTFGRALSLRSRKLNATIGLTETGNGDIRGIGSLAFEQAFKTGTLNADFSQTVVTSTNDVDEQNSQLRVGYKYAITPVSGLNLALTMAQSDRLDPTLDDYRRASAEIVYVRDLTEDWSMNAGYRHSVARQTNTDPVIENRIFATIDRRFSLRP